MSRHGLRTALSVLAIPLWLLTVVTPADARQAQFEVVGPTAKIPRDSFKSWSLFLICNQDWVAPERSADLSNLYWRFKAFGDAIGKDNLAVWFWREKLPSNDPKLALNVDVPKSIEYCTALGLTPSEGPHLVVTTSYPDLAAFPKERAVYALGNLPPAALAKLLGSLTNQLVAQNKVEAILADAAKSAPVAAVAPSSLWMRLLESARQTIVGFGCAVKLGISAGPLSAELRGCSGEWP
jgi:hypothetical protein